MFDTIRILDSYRKRSEDRAEVISHKSGLVIVLADGAGGISGGAEAADTVVMWTKAFVSGNQILNDPAQWAEFLSKLDYQINCGGGSGNTTAVVASVTEEGICGASVGDSAAWIIHRTTCLDLTRDQVQKPLLGSGCAKPIPFQNKGFDGTLMVASDGLVKYAAREKICRIVAEKDLAAAGRGILDLARLRSGQLQDDVARSMSKKGYLPHSSIICLRVPLPQSGYVRLCQLTCLLTRGMARRSRSRDLPVYHTRLNSFL